MKQPSVIKGLLFLALLFCFGIQVFAQEECNKKTFNHFNDNSGMDFEYEKARLRFAAEYLKLCPNKVVYLFALNAKRKPKSTAIERLKKSKRYLIYNYGISSKRIITIYWGTSDEIRMNIAFDDKKSPSPSPLFQLRNF